MRNSKMQMPSIDGVLNKQKALLVGSAVRTLIPGRSILVLLEGRRMVNPCVDKYILHLFWEIGGQLRSPLIWRMAMAIIIC